MHFQYYWGSPAAGVYSQGRSLAKLTITNYEELVFSPLVTFEL